MTRRLLTMQETADALSLSRSKTYELVMAGKIGSVKIGRSRRVTTSALDAFIAEARDA